MLLGRGAEHQLSAAGNCAAAGAYTVYPGAPGAAQQVQQPSLYAAQLPPGTSFKSHSYGQPARSYLPPSPYASARQFTAWGVPAPGQQPEKPSTEFHSVKLV